MDLMWLKYTTRGSTRDGYRYQRPDPGAMRITLGQATTVRFNRKQPVAELPANPQRSVREFQQCASYFRRTSCVLLCSHSHSDLPALTHVRQAIRSGGEVWSRECLHRCSLHADWLPCLSKTDGKNLLPLIRSLQSVTSLPSSANHFLRYNDIWRILCQRGFPRFVPIRNHRCCDERVPQWLPNLYCTAPQPVWGSFPGGPTSTAVAFNSASTSSRGEIGIL